MANVKYNDSMTHIRDLFQTRILCIYLYEGSNHMYLLFQYSYKLSITYVLICVLFAFA